MSRIVSIFIFLSFLLSMHPVNAQTLTAKSYAKDIEVGEVFEVIFELNGANIQKFKPPKFKGVQVVGTQQTVESGMRNGRTSYVMSITYSLRADRPRTVTIPAASAKYKDKILYSKPLYFAIAPASKKKKTISDNREDLFIELVVVDTPAHPGSQVIVDYVLHAAMDLDQLLLMDEDDYKGFIFHVFKKDIPTFETTIEGKRYVSRVIRRVALYAKQAGVVKIEPLTLKVYYHSRAKGVLGQLFASLNRRKKIVKSPSFQIRTFVFPKPIPNDFSGATGSINLEAFLGDVDITTDDAVSLKIKVTGSSNPTEIKAPVLLLPNELTFFPARVIEDTIIEENGAFVFTKTFDYLIQPQQAGLFSIQAKTAFFDSDSNAFVEVKSDIMSLAVRKGKTFYEDKDESISSSSDASFSPWLWAVLALFCAGILFFILRKKQPEKVITNRDDKGRQVVEKKNVQREKTLVSTAEKLPINASFEFKAAGKGKGYLQELLKQVNKYFAQELKEPYGKINKEFVCETLTKKGLDTSLIAELKNWWTDIEAAIYANKPLPYEEGKTLEIIQTLTRKIGKE